MMVTYTLLVMLVVVSQSFQAVMEAGDEERLGSEDAVFIPFSNIEVAHQSSPTIRELVGDLDKSWGNSKDWMLQLRDGRQIVLPLSLYRFLESELDCSVLDGEAVTSNTPFVNEGHIVGWTDESDGIVDSMSIATGSEDELWEFDERLMIWERGGKPLVVVPLAIEAPLEDEVNYGKEIRCKENAYSKQLSQGVTN